MYNKISHLLVSWLSQKQLQKFIRNQSLQLTYYHINFKTLRFLEKFANDVIIVIKKN